MALLHLSTVYSTNRGATVPHDKNSQRHTFEVQTALNRNDSVSGEHCRQIWHIFLQWSDAVTATLLFYLCPSCTWASCHGGKAQAEPIHLLMLSNTVTPHNMRLCRNPFIRPTSAWIGTVGSRRTRQRRLSHVKRTVPAPVALLVSRPADGCFFGAMSAEDRNNEQAPRACLHHKWWRGWENGRKVGGTAAISP